MSLLSTTNTIVVILKANNDLERMGDFAVNVATTFSIFYTQPTLSCGLIGIDQQK